VRQVLKVSLDVARGMEYLHSTFEAPVIHRDLKSPVRRAFAQLTIAPLN
jgi:serine/threonine protein kinase